MQKYCWEDLSAADRDAPYFTLDPQCAIYSDETPTANANLDIAIIDEIKEEETDTSTPMPICEMKALPLPPTYAKRSLGATCRNKLDQLKGLTFNIADQKALTDLEKKLSTIRNETREIMEKQDNLMAENEQQFLGKRSATSHRPKKLQAKKTKQQQHVQLAIEKNRRKETRLGAKADHERMQRNSPMNGCRETHP